MMYGSKNNIDDSDGIKFILSNVRGRELEKKFEHDANVVTMDVFIVSMALIILFICLGSNPALKPFRHANKHPRLRHNLVNFES